MGIGLRRPSRAATFAFQSSAGALPITFSAVVAQYCVRESIADLLNRADEALYRAKAGVRDRVEISEVSAPAAA